MHFQLIQLLFQILIIGYWATDVKPWICSFPSVYLNIFFAALLFLYCTWAQPGTLTKYIMIHTTHFHSKTIHSNFFSESFPLHSFFIFFHVLHNVSIVCFLQMYYSYLSAVKVEQNSQNNQVKNNFLPIHLCITTL